jgi:hypothetical protein
MSKHKAKRGESKSADASLRSGMSLQRAAQLMGGLGGKKGGPARAHVLSKARRVTIARQGGRAAHKGK